MNQSDYARHRKVAKSYISKLISSGRIPDGALVQQGGRRMIDVAAADHALGVNVERVIAREEPDEDEGFAGAGAAGESLAPSPGGALTKAKTATEIYRARMAKLEFDKRLLEVLPRAQTFEAARACGEAAARAIDQITMRADELVAAVQQEGAHGARRVLKDIARDIRNRLADEMAALPRTILQKSAAANATAPAPGAASAAELGAWSPAPSPGAAGFEGVPS